MAQQGVLKGFVNMAVLDLLAKTDTIILGMSDNPYFPSPSPTIAEVQAKKDALNDTAVMVTKGNKSQILNRNQLQAELITLLQNLADYVNFISKGNLVMATTSGYSLPKTPSRTADITKPERLYVKDGINNGELLVGIKRVKTANSYIYQYTTDVPDASATWIAESSTYVKHTFTNLERGKTYYCRVAAVGARKQVVFSDVVSRISQ